MREWYRNGCKNRKKLYKHSYEEVCYSETIISWLQSGYKVFSLHVLCQKHTEVGWPGLFLITMHLKTIPRKLLCTEKWRETENDTHRTKTIIESVLFRLCRHIQDLNVNTYLYGSQVHQPLMILSNSSLGNGSFDSKYALIASSSSVSSNISSF